MQVQTYFLDHVTEHNKELFYSFSLADLFPMTETLREKCPNTEFGPYFLAFRYFSRREVFLLM